MSHRGKVMRSQVSEYTLSGRGLSKSDLVLLLCKMPTEMIFIDQCVCVGISIKHIAGILTQQLVPHLCKQHKRELKARKKAQLTVDPQSRGSREPVGLLTLSRQLLIPELPWFGENNDR